MQHRFDPPTQSTICYNILYVSTAVTYVNYGTGSAAHTKWFSILI